MRELSTVSWLARLPFTPFQFGAQHVEKGPVRKFEELNRKLRFAALHHVSFLQRLALLPIHAEISLFPRDRKTHFNNSGITHHQRAIGKCVRSNRRDDESRNLRRQNGTAGSQGVSGGAGGSGNDQPIRPVLRNKNAVDLYFKISNASYRALVHHNIIERIVVGYTLSVAAHPAMQHGALT